MGTKQILIAIALFGLVSCQSQEQKAAEAAKQASLAQQERISAQIQSLVSTTKTIRNSQFAIRNCRRN